MRRLVTLSEDLWWLMKARATAERCTVPVLVDRLLRASLPPPPRTEAEREADKRAMAKVSAESLTPKPKRTETVETPETATLLKCTRCGHFQHQHTPRCYVAACMCRKFQEAE